MMRKLNIDIILRCCYGCNSVFLNKFDMIWSVIFIGSTIELDSLQYAQNSDILRFIIDSGMININDVQNRMEVMKRKELLEKHPYKIWQEIGRASCRERVSA